MKQQNLHEIVAERVAAAASTIRTNDVSAVLGAEARKNGEVLETPQGAIVAETGKFTGRSPSDKFIVRDAKTDKTVWWDNSNAMSPEHFDLLLADMLEAAKGRHFYQQQLFAGADPESRYQVELFTPNAWHALFIRHLMIRPNPDELQGFAPSVTVFHLPDFEADPARHGTKTETVIALDLSRNTILIAGTQYAGEMKKSIFSLFNYHAPEDDILPMHCSANLGEQGDTTLFFGLSGTGKTTLSASPHRALIGDDEHGWSSTGVFNLEGGCYAKAVGLRPETEPEIYAAAMTPDSVMENVIIDDMGHADFDDISKTENTRIAYPLTAIPHRVGDSRGPAPQNIVLLTADAFGVLPPIARLNHEQTIYYFLAGYTAKVAGTERGVTEPTATFSTCFGAPFMARHPREYGELLGKRLAEGEVNCWLLNTGWTGGAYGVGSRMKLRDTRQMLEEALAGNLNDVEYRIDEIFGLEVPLAVEGVDSAVLHPEMTWADKDAYRAAARKLVGMFDANMEKLGIDHAALLGAGVNANAA
ncbi:MAG: phosphoenolpyruvate carboxykinase (ATP) [Hyphomicrobiaceae bacterium]|nr:phosphoenolpyruvate carboxykinase (ATP) [Hyphomicrobiaceae bacterium]MCC0025230.1 phosphoenolpyruvate carboxykinase (ATP) [Hyphomicrobiaceae bacterium]